MHNPDVCFIIDNRKPKSKKIVSTDDIIICEILFYQFIRDIWYSIFFTKTCILLLYTQMLKLLVLLSVALVACSAQRCRNCQVNGGSYRGGSNFQFDRGCSRFSCRCNCDGSWNCPSSLTTNKCTGGGYQSAGACRNCVAYGRTYGRGPFQMDQGCFRYKCNCNCNGSWNCPAERTISIC